MAGMRAVESCCIYLNKIVHIPSIFLTEGIGLFLGTSGVEWFTDSASQAISGARI